MASSFSLGSKQYVVVTVRDSSAVITTLEDATDVSYTIKKSDGTAMVTDEAIDTIDAMKLKCLVDTSVAGLGGAWAALRYNMWVKFTKGDQSPVLGPFVLTVR